MNICIRKAVEVDPDYAQFGPGERVIIVDGVRWGRTYAEHLSRYGVRYWFKDAGGSVIYAPGYKPSYTKKDDWHRELVTISRRNGRSKLDPPPAKNTDEAILIKVRELIERGQLRNPSVIKAEAEARRAQFAADRAAAATEESRRFREKAIEALGDCLNGTVERSEMLIDRVVAAMRWAQTQ